VADPKLVLQHMIQFEIRADRRFVHAYPGVENGPSNSLCRKVGFELLGAHEFEYPAGSGTMMRCNDWRFDLFG